MSKKGFTLVELLAVLVLLTVIVLVAFPNIIGAVKSTNDQLDKATTTLLESIARSYANDNPVKYPTTTTKNYCVNVEDLVKEGYTQSPIANVSESDAKEIEKAWSVSFSCGSGKCTKFQVKKARC